jgi:hypothetical protein
VINKAIPSIGIDIWCLIDKAYIKPRDLLHPSFEEFPRNSRPNVDRPQIRTAIAAYLWALPEFVKDYTKQRASSGGTKSD